MSSAAALGGTAAPWAQAQHHLLQEFEYFLVVDFEATCEKDSWIYPQEIIEFPSVLVDGATGRIESAFRRIITRRKTLWQLEEAVRSSLMLMARVPAVLPLGLGTMWPPMPATVGWWQRLHHLR